MATIKISVFINSTPDKVWEIISDIDKEPKYWKGTKEVKNISKEGNVVNRKITIAFRDSKCKQQVILFPKEKIEAQFTEGIIQGTKTLNLIPKGEGVNLEAVWDMKLSGMMGMFTGMIKKHVKNGTEQALQSIKEESERQD